MRTAPATGTANAIAGDGSAAAGTDGNCGIGTAGGVGGATEAAAGPGDGGAASSSTLTTCTAGWLVGGAGSEAG